MAKVQPVVIKKSRMTDFKEGPPSTSIYQLLPAPVGVFRLNRLAGQGNSHSSSYTRQTSSPAPSRVLRQRALLSRAEEARLAAQGSSGTRGLALLFASGDRRDRSESMLYSNDS